MSVRRDPRYAVSTPRGIPEGLDPELEAWANDVVRVLQDLQSVVVQGGLRVRIPMVKDRGSDARALPDMAGETLIVEDDVALHVHYGSRGWRRFISRDKLRKMLDQFFTELDAEGVTLTTAAQDRIKDAMDI